MGTTKRGESWQTSFMISGTRHRASFTTKQAGELWEAEVRNAISEGREIPEAKTGGVTQGGGRTQTLGELLTTVARDKWSDKKSGDKLAQNGTMFVKWVGPNQPIRGITSAMLYEYVAYLRSTGNSNATVNRKLSAVKVMLRWAERNNIINKVPYVEKFKEKSAEASSDFFDFGEEDEVVALLHHRGYHRIAHLFLFVLDTGCRIQEALNLHYTEVARDRITLNRTKSGGWRVIPMTTRAQLMIRNCQAVTGDQDKPFGDITYRYALDNLIGVYQALGGRYANIDKPFHILRHSCASRLALRGVDAKRIMDWMGHSNISVTQRYMKLSPTALDAAMATLEPEAPKLKVVQ